MVMREVRGSKQRQAENSQGLSKARRHNYRFRPRLTVFVDVSMSLSLAKPPLHMSLCNGKKTGGGRGGWAACGEGIEAHKSTSAMASQSINR